MDKITIKTAVFYLKKTFQQQIWWVYVQDPVKEQIDFIMTNLEYLGISFRDAFVASFRLEHLRRVVLQEAHDNAVAGAFPVLTEECYQSSLNPMKALLSLNDWVQPNDSDVLAIMYLCQQIDILESSGVLGEAKTEEPSKPEEKECPKEQKESWSFVKFGMNLAKMILKKK